MKNKKGFTLIELIVVIAILGILALFLVPSFLGYTKDAQKATCEANRHIIERSYTFYKAKSAEEITLSKYIDSEEGEEYKGSKCPAGGVYTYDDDKVICSIHGEDEDKNEGTGEESGEGETPDQPGEQKPDENKIPGTNLDLDYNKIIIAVQGENHDYPVQRGSIIQVKDSEGNIIKYYIARNTSTVNLSHGISDLVELTNDPAVTVNGTGQDAIINAFNNKIEEGQKIIYDNKYYICRENVSGWSPVPGKSDWWIEIK